MHYTKLIKRYQVVSQPQQQPTQVAVETYTLKDDEVLLVMRYLKYLEDEYFKDIPLSTSLDKSFVWNIPKTLYKYITYLDDIGDVPVSANPLTMLYGLCLDDPNMYPNFIERYIMIATDPEEQKVLIPYIIKYKTDVSADDDDESSDS